MMKQSDTPIFEDRDDDEYIKWESQAHDADNDPVIDEEENEKE